MSAAIVDHNERARLFAYVDPAIKLFGRDIPATASISHEASGYTFVGPDEQLSDQDVKPNLAELEECNEPMDAVLNTSGMSGCINDGNYAMGGTVAVKKVVNDVPFAPAESLDFKGENSQGLLAASHEKVPMKPEKLIPCPRCHSLDTKFCYFNNYNTKQPRHFCRKCQRYWTAGGTLRNVPVGAGRRKHKHSTSHQKHLLGSDTMLVGTNAANFAHHPRCSVSFSSSGGSELCSPSKPTLNVLPAETHCAALGRVSPSSNNTMLNFGQESSLCKCTAATALSMQECGAVQNNEVISVNVSVSGDRKIAAASGKRLSEVVQGVSCNTASSSVSGCYDAVPAKLLKKAVQSSSCATINSPADSLVEAVPTGGEVQGGRLSEAGYANCGAGWHQPGSDVMPNSSFNPATAYTVEGKAGVNDSPLRPQPTNMLPSCNGAPGSFWTGFPWPFMNAAMWGPPSGWVGPWTLPFCSPAAAVAATAAAAAAAATLLPFSASANTLEKPQQSNGSQPEKCLWVPKTLRINDPLDAARSSIWTTLGLGDGPLSHPVNGSSAKLFQIRSEFKDYNETTNSQQHMNPAALSRSAAFHENS